MPPQECPLLNRFLILSATMLSLALSSPAQNAKSHPWSNPSLSPDERAAMVVKEMTLNEKISLLHGDRHGWTESDEPAGRGTPTVAPDMCPAFHASVFPRFRCRTPLMACGPAARTAATRPLCPPTWRVRRVGTSKRAMNTEHSLAANSAPRATTWSLGGGTDLTREPRNGRTFEYLGEDPVLAGKMVEER